MTWLIAAHAMAGPVPTLLCLLAFWFMVGTLSEKD